MLGVVRLAQVARASILFIILAIPAYSQNVGPKGGRWNDCALALERLVLLTDSSTSNVVLSPQTRTIGDPWVPRMKFQSPKGRLVVEVLNDGLARFEWSGDNGLPPDQEPILSTPLIKQKAHEGASHVQVRNNGTEIETPDVILKVDPNTLGITILDKKRGNKFMGHVYPNYLNGLHKEIAVAHGILEPEVEGVAASPRDSRATDAGYKWDEYFGPRPDGNGMTLYDWNAAPTANQTPVFHFHNGADNYMLLADTGGMKTEGYFKDPSRSYIKIRGEHPRLYLMTGKDIPEAHGKLMDLVGKPSLFPKFMTGYAISMLGHKNWMEQLSMPRNIQNAGMRIPKLLFFDLPWYGMTFGTNNDPSGKEMGIFDWDRRPDKYPTPEVTLKWLRERGVDVAIIMEPYIDERAHDFQHMVNNGYLVKGQNGQGYARIDPRGGGFWPFAGGMFDMSSPGARDYFFKTRLLPRIQEGVQLFWFDLLDPEISNPDGIYSNSDGIGPYHYQNHNIYANYWSTMLKEGVQKYGVKNRVTMMSRASNLGYDGATWTGDINAGQYSMAAHFREVADMSFTGQAGTKTSNVGGFWRRGPQANSDEEYTRWLVHSMIGGDMPPWIHVYNLDTYHRYLPSEIGSWDSNRFAMHERSQMEPYWYSLLWDETQSGMPPRSSPSFYNQKDFGLKGNSELIIGRNDLLMAQSFNQGEGSRNVRLPAGNRWVNWITKESFDGGQTLQNVPVYLPDGKFWPPLYAREGSIFPRTEQRDSSVADNSNDIAPINHDMVLRVFPGPNKGMFKLYEDDGRTNDHKKGAYRTTDIYQQLNGKTLNIDINPSQGSYTDAPSDRKHKLEIATRNLDVDKIHINGHELYRCNSANDFDNWTEGYLIDNANKTIVVKTGPMNVTWQKNFTVTYK